MSSITISEANIRPILPLAQCRRKDCGGTVTAGEIVYIDSNGAVQPVDADAASTSRVYGIAIADNDGGTSFSSGEAIDVCVFGPVTGFTSLSPGSLLYNSPTAGAMDESAPGSGDYLWVVGIIENSTTVFVNPFTDSLAVQS